GRLGLEPSLSLDYSSQGAIYGGLAAGWTLAIPEIRADNSFGLAGRSLLGEPLQFTSSLAGGNRLIAVTEDADTDVVQTFRAQDDPTYTRYERLTSKRWRARAQDGRIFVFNEAANIDGPVEVGYAPLTHIEDPFGNRV